MVLKPTRRPQNNTNMDELIQRWLGWVVWSVGGGDTLVSRESCHGVAVTEVVGRGGGLVGRAEV